MRDDIVERLRSEHRMALAPIHMSDAADEIVRLRAENERLRDAGDGLARMLRVKTEKHWDYRPHEGETGLALRNWMQARKPHEPRLDYICEDPDCCDNGCPVVTCRSCREYWPCTDWRSRHTPSQVLAQVRYVARKKYPGDPDMVEYIVRQEASRG